MVRLDVGHGLTHKMLNLKNKPEKAVSKQVMFNTARCRGHENFAALKNVSLNLNNFGDSFYREALKTMDNFLVFRVFG